jgi:hypothetical protein
MPIYEIGYRDWEGRRRGPASRWWAITRAGVRLGFRNWVLKKLFYFVYAPLLYFAPLFLAIGSVTDRDRTADLQGMWQAFNAGFFGREVTRVLVENPEVARPAAWSLVFYFFFANVQLFVVFVVVAFVGPPLLARDIRSKGYLVYFAKPITVGEYLLGKGGVVVSFVFLVTLAPALLLYAISIAYSPSIGALVDTWDTVARILAASIVLAVPCALVVLALSSIVPDVRYAAFAWIAICVFGEIAYRMVIATPGLRDSAWAFLLSPRAILGSAYEWIFDVQTHLETFGGSSRIQIIRDVVVRTHSPALALGALAAISAGCLAALRRRIGGLMRA